jgi:hypothetical protein
MGTPEGCTASPLSLDCEDAALEIASLQSHQAVPSTLIENFTVPGADEAGAVHVSVP